MNISEIIEQLVVNEVITDYPKGYKKLTGGTISRLYLLEGKEQCVVKLNEPKVIEEEAYFLDFYENESIFPKLLYIDPLNRYMVYSFIPGSTSYHARDKRDILCTLVQKVIDRYKPAMSMDQWGWKEGPVDSRQDFLLNRVMEANENVKSYITQEEFHSVLKLVHSPNRTAHSNQPYVLHGDCGFHNFIFKEHKLYGVIDPLPVLGDPIYDLIYAFCSTPEDLTKETIDYVVEQCVFHKNTKGKVLYEEVLIGLYLRLETCIRHHPEDLEAYLIAWRYWINELQ
ncbi:aminoglycoside/hydroxyurea antibiotic resistance kinase family protein [Bacillus pseudomycoides]|uniref:aminoglycoside phosphotransferase family protein n=1 Tax=Bacillus pseudomycoides TaxID=64104 RepID=UPI0004ED821B|nr:aminoglycoside phosphotransferase family protein [Bacillus pseudomycoides]AIK37545.1 aminoglycoside/hydroxyurea antibiotic resistance kinase family protein [Bacillus pseudomycoides]AJI19137.1 aminoglycoside/hydroxyurea antibiotic resistance kinase family protein [Bacillus pseudomycoides]